MASVEAAPMVDIVAAAPPEQEFLYEGGRRFANPKFKSPYTLPNDEEEKGRLDRQHLQFLLTLEGALHRAPLEREKVKEVVDLGAGTGIWASDFAKEYPEAKVVGIDISPVPTEGKPDNCTFVQANFFSDAAWPSTPATISYIHSRFIAAGVGDWSGLARRCYEQLAPGGWFECQELVFPLRCDDGTASPDNPCMRWSELQTEGGAALGVDLKAAEKVPSMMEEAGFVDVKVEPYKWPNNPWSDDPLLKQIGENQQHNFRNGLEAFSLGFYMKGLGWDRERLDKFLDEVRESVLDPNEHIYVPVLFISGRKPLA